MPSVDFAILTGLVEELRTVLSIFPESEEVSEDADVWFRTRVSGGNKGENYEIVAAYQTSMGPLAAQALTTSVIKRWDPAYIILVGIAGSFNEDVKLGDVIVSQQIFYYDLGKITSEGLAYRPEGYPCSAVLVRQAEALQFDQKAFNSWLQAAKESAARKAEALPAKDPQQASLAATSLRAYSPTIHFGTVASGSLVVADKEKQAELLRLHGKIIGTEMEGAGVLHATFTQDVPTAAVVIKGISDAADKDKDAVDALGYWRELAKETPARLALEIIRRGKIRPVRTDQFYLDPTQGSVAETRAVIQRVSAPGNSYLGFPRLIVPKGPLTGIRIQVAVSGKDGTLDLAELVIRYVDREGKIRSEVVNAPPYAVELSQHLPATPLGLYMLILGEASQIRFIVETTNTKLEATWPPTS